MGRGPGHLLAHGLHEVLGAGGSGVREITLESASELPTEVSTTFELDGLVAEEVREAARANEFPFVLSGNCAISVGTLSGLGNGEVGIIWFDAHADFNTPETTTSGFSDGMGAAVAVGHCWRAMAARIPGFAPLPEANLLLVGTRDVGGSEQRRLDESEVGVVAAREIRETDAPHALGAALDALGMRAGRVYVHLDLDVLDPEKVGPANGFAAAGGLSREEVEEALHMIRERFEIAAGGIASFDPACDGPGGEVLEAALSFARILAGPPHEV